MAIRTFDEVVDVIVEVTGVERSRITPGARLEQDLGVTGDDGLELLEALAERFGVDFNRPDHGGRYLFRSEGSVDVLSIIGRMLGRQTAQVIPITVGDLHLAVARGLWEDPPWPAI